jgi:hypothetical protein
MVKKDLAPATVKAAYLALAKILRTAELDGFIVRSPCIGIDLPKETSHQDMRFLEPGKSTARPLGHSSIRVTLDRYGHLYPSVTEALRQAWRPSKRIPCGRSGGLK